MICSVSACSSNLPFQIVFSCWLALLRTSSQYIVICLFFCHLKSIKFVGVLDPTAYLISFLLDDGRSGILSQCELQAAEFEVDGEFWQQPPREEELKVFSLWTLG